MLIKYDKKYLTKFTFIGLLVSAIMSTYYFYDYLIQTSYSVLPQAFDDQFNLTTFKYSLLGSMFFYGYTLLQVPAGYLIDTKGIRQTIIIFCGLCVTGLVLFTFANSYWMLIVGRFLIGAGSAAAFLCATVGFSRWLPQRAFSVAMGLLQLLASIGSICGQSGVSYLTGLFGWKDVFIGLSISGLVLIVIYFMTITNALERNTSKKKKKQSNIKELLKQKQLYWISILGLISWSSVTAMANIFLIRYLYWHNHWSTETSSNSLIVFWLAIGLSAPWLGHFSNFLKSRKAVLYIGFSIQIICTLYIIWFPNYSPLLLSFVFIGLGASASLQIYMFLLVRENVKANLLGSASGLVNMCVVAGGGILAPIVGGIISVLHEHYGYSYSNAYNVGFYIFPILAIIGLLISIFYIKETYSK
jgi:MFS family permease